MCEESLSVSPRTYVIPKNRFTCMWFGDDTHQPLLNLHLFQLQHARQAGVVKMNGADFERELNGWHSNRKETMARFCDTWWVSPHQATTEINLFFQLHLKRPKLYWIQSTTSKACLSSGVYVTHNYHWEIQLILLEEERVCSVMMKGSERKISTIICEKMHTWRNGRSRRHSIHWTGQHTRRSM